MSPLLHWALYSTYGILGIVALDFLALALVVAAARIARHLARRAYRPQPDWTTLTGCRWCADLSDDPRDCTCAVPCEHVSWCVTAIEDAERLITDEELAAFLESEGGNL